MFSRTAQVFVPTRTQVRGMATLKEIRVRLKSVINIQKITKSMKMVSAAKYARAERELKPARSYGAGAQAFFDKAEVALDDSKPQQLVVALTSDRGLCGGVHSNICKAIKHRINDQDASIDTKLVLIGDKSRQILSRLYAKNVLMTFNNIGKKPPNFNDAALLADELTSLGYQYDYGTLYYNVFKSVVSYRTTELPLYTDEDINSAKKLSVYDSVDEDTLRCYNEFSFVSRLYFAMKESACSEQSSRMTAMDAASKNASEMIDKLTLTFNRTRQAVITRELIEIISGAAAL